MSPTSWASGVAVAMLLTSVAALPAEAATGRLNVSSSSGIAGETRTFSGGIGGKVVRPVVLQRYASPGWAKVSSGRTDKAGRFTFSTTIRSTSTTYRVTASKTKIRKKWFAAVATPNRKITTSKQSATVALSGPAAVGTPTTVTWTFAPARAGRIVHLLRSSGSAWTTIGTGKQQPDGKVSFAWTPMESGTAVLRASAPVHTTGAAAFAVDRPIDVAPRPPADVDLTNWKLTLPIDKDGNTDDSAAEVKHPRLPGDESEYFHLNEDGSGIVFRADTGGATTSGSGYPRSELREMKDDGDKKAEWDSTDGKQHVLTVTEAITHLPGGKPHVVAGQIHDDSDDVVMIRLEDKHLFVEADGDDIGTLDSNYTLGTVFTIEILANEDGIRVSYNGTPKVVYDKTGDGWYFKAGCYTQASSKVDPSSSKYGTGFGEVVIHSLHVEHRP